MDLKNTQEKITDLLQTCLSDEEFGSLMHYLDIMKFWKAPYSTKYQYSYEGGLADYSLATYNALRELCNDYNVTYNEKELVVVGLLHAVAKCEYYEKFVSNKKVYSKSGENVDLLGVFDWNSFIGYTLRDVDDRYTAGNLGMTSYMIISRYVALSEESIMAIIYCFYNDNTKDIYTLLRRYPLIALVHCASTLITNVGVVKQCPNN